jgi:hypothetical protein
MKRRNNTNNFNFTYNDFSIIVESDIIERNFILILCDNMLNNIYILYNHINNNIILLDIDKINIFLSYNSIEFVKEKYTIISIYNNNIYGYRIPFENQYKIKIIVKLLLNTMINNLSIYGLRNPENTENTLPFITFSKKENIYLIKNKDNIRESMVQYNIYNDLINKYDKHKILESLSTKYETKKNKNFNKYMKYKLKYLKLKKSN